MTGHGEHRAAQDGRTPVLAGPGGPDASSGADGAPVSPAGADELMEWLVRCGWKSSGGIPGRYSVWEPERHNGDWNVLVPADSTKRDYEALLRRAWSIFARFEGPRLLGVVRAVEALHQADWSCGNPNHTNPAVGCPDCDAVCAGCGENWPCPTICIAREGSA